jgi:nucleotide-binding universal stress UspA family protein
MESTSAAKAGMKVLLGYDGSDCARAAIADLPRAAMGPTGEVTVVSVADITAAVTRPVMVPAGVEGIGTWETDVGEALALRDKAEARANRTAAEGAALAAGALPGWRVHQQTAIDSPYWGLIRAAEEWPADLIVVGSHGRSALGRMLLGSVSGYVLSHARCSVRISRPRREPVQVGVPGKSEETPAAPRSAEAVRIVVGADGSEGGQAALHEVSRRPWPAGSEVRVVTAVDERLATTFAAYAAWLVDRQTRLNGIRQVLDAVVDDLHDAGLNASAAVIMGDPKQVLVHVAEQWQADCIFLGARGHSRLERFLLGSVSAAVAARAPCSVEVIR